VELQVPGDRVKLPPFGLLGGRNGTTTAYVRVRGGEELPLRTKHAYTLEKGDTLSVRTSGGGGLGDPKERDPAAVVLDVADGYISPEHAEAEYGVAIDATGRASDD
jgi:N-methylhydantoinase B